MNESQKKIHEFYDKLIDWTRQLDARFVSLEQSIATGLTFPPDNPVDIVDQTYRDLIGRINSYRRIAAQADLALGRIADHLNSKYGTFARHYFVGLLDNLTLKVMQSKNNSLNSTDSVQAEVQSLRDFGSELGFKVSFDTASHVVTLAGEGSATRVALSEAEKQEYGVRFESAELEVVLTGLSTRASDLRCSVHFVGSESVELNGGVDLAVFTAEQAEKIISTLQSTLDVLKRFSYSNPLFLQNDFHDWLKKEFHVDFSIISSISEVKIYLEILLTDLQFSERNKSLSKLDRVTELVQLTHPDATQLDTQSFQQPWYASLVKSHPVPFMVDDIDGGIAVAATDYLLFSRYGMHQFDFEVEKQRALVVPETDSERNDFFTRAITDWNTNSTLGLIKQMCALHETKPSELLLAHAHNHETFHAADKGRADGKYENFAYELAAELAALSCDKDLRVLLLRTFENQARPGFYDHNYNLMAMLQKEYAKRPLNGYYSFAGQILAIDLVARLVVGQSLFDSDSTNFIPKRNVYAKMNEKLFKILSISHEDMKAIQDQLVKIVEAYLKETNREYWLEKLGYSINEPVDFGQKKVGS